MTPLETAFDQLQEASFWSYGWTAVIFFVLLTVVSGFAMKTGASVLLSIYNGVIFSSFAVLVIGLVFSSTIPASKREAVTSAVKEYTTDHLGAENVLFLDESFRKGYTMDIVYSDPDAGIYRLQLRYEEELGEMVTLLGNPLYELPSEDS